MHPEWRERLRSSLAVSAVRGAQWRMEFPIRRRDGADRWLLGAASPQRLSQPGDDGRTAWFGYIADVTDLRELEAASRDKAAAEAASRAKTEFLSRMSHELRTPLNAVLGFSQLLELSQTPPLADAHRRPVQLIREAGEHLLTMIGDLLDLTRIESGQLRLQIEQRGAGAAGRRVRGHAAGASGQRAGQRRRRARCGRGRAAPTARA